jgi:transposase
VENQLHKFIWRVLLMISVGIDVSKGKSTVCILKPYGEILSGPFEVEHTDISLDELKVMLLRLNEEVKIVMEATGVYHLPILDYLLEAGLFVSVVSPLLMKKYRSRDIRNVKTDKRDALNIANYGIDYWYRLEKYQPQELVYNELKLLGRQYRSYMEMRIKAVQNLTHLLDYTMPGIKGKLSGWNEKSGKDKLSDFASEFWHFDNIKKYSEAKFIEKYNCWAKKKGYRQSCEKAEKIYYLACTGIPTIASTTPSTKMLIVEAIKVLREINNTLGVIITRMKELSKTLPEYETVRAMGGVGDVLASKLIAEIGDVRRFHSKNALIAHAGIDVPPYESGQFIGRRRKITKRGSAHLRKIGYEVMRCLKAMKEPEDGAVHQFILKKEAEGKPKKVAKIAGLNKFLKIYYARVMEVYQP